MQFTVIQTFDNYVSAHIAMGRLQEDGINCWLKDENTVTIDPMLTNAVGGIKLMVADMQAQRAAGILRMLDSKNKALNPCTKCGSQNVELVSSPRKASNWIGVIIGLLFTNYGMAVNKVLHCFDCGHEYDVGEKPGDNNYTKNN